MSVFILFFILGLILSFYIANKAHRSQPSRNSHARLGLPIELVGKGEYALPVVGESHYQTHLKLLCGGYSSGGHYKGVKARLHYENSNPHDNKAVRVDIEGKTVGYLSRTAARAYRRAIEAVGQTGDGAEVEAVITGGWHRGGEDVGSFGVMLDLPAGLDHAS